MSSRNGIITGYVLTTAVARNSSGNDVLVNVTVLGPEVLFYEVTDMVLNAYYNITLAAQTSAGVGPIAFVQVSTFLTGII